MRIVVAVTLMLALGGSATAQTQSFFLHHDDTPVSIPGGTSQFFLDALAPLPTTPLAEELVIPANGTQSFPTFVSPAFASGTTLSPVASVRLYFGANAKMKACGAITTQILKVDAVGVMTPIGTGSVTATDIAQSSSSGTVGATSHLVEFPISPATIGAGEGVAVATSFTNQCNINRRVFFAYDGQSAPSRVRFQCCLSVAAKCSESKLKAVATFASCLLGNEGSATSQGELTDPARQAKCAATAFKAFTKAEEKGGCITVGDAGDRLTDTQSFASLRSLLLDPAGPLHKTKCQGSKLKLTGKTAKCLLALEAKAAATGEFLDPDPTKAQKCRDLLPAGFGKLEAKVGNDCDTAADANATLAAVEAFETAIAGALACPCAP